MNDKKSIEWRRNEIFCEPHNSYANLVGMVVAENWGPPPSNISRSGFLGVGGTKCWTSSALKFKFLKEVHYFSLSRWHPYRWRLPRARPKAGAQEHRSTKAWDRTLGGKIRASPRPAAAPRPFEEEHEKIRGIGENRPSRLRCTPWFHPNEPNQPRKDFVTISKGLLYTCAPSIKRR